MKLTTQSWDNMRNKEWCLIDDGRIVKTHIKKTLNSFDIDPNKIIKIYVEDFASYGFNFNPHDIIAFSNDYEFLKKLYSDIMKSNKK